MKIKRTIDGQEHEFELTERELSDAYYEQEHNYDKEDIVNEVESLDVGEIYEFYGVTREQFSSLVPQMAYEKRRLMDKYGRSWDTAVGEAIRNVIKNYKQEMSKDLAEKGMPEKVAYYKGNIAEQITVLTDGEYCTPAQQAYLTEHLNEITEKYVLKGEAWEAEHKTEMPLEVDIEIMQDVILTAAEEAMEYEITFRDPGRGDTLITMEAGQLMVQFPGEEEKRFLRSHIQDIKEGDVFFGPMELLYIAAFDAHRNFDEPDNPWIVYDSLDNGWFEKDIINANLKFGGLLRESLFVFEEELCVSDDSWNSIDGYLCATDSLVSRVRDQLKDRLSQAELDSMENINFYPDYNVRMDTIELEAHFYYTNNRGKETAHGLHIPLSENEAASLKAIMEEYCQATNKMSCKAFVEEVKTRDAHQEVLDALKNGLKNTLQDGEYGQFIDVCAEVPLAYSDKPNHVLVAWGEENDEDDKFFSLAIQKTDGNGRCEDQVPGMQVFSDSEDLSELAPLVHKLLTDFDKLPVQERAGETKPLSAIISNAQQRRDASIQTTDKTNTKEPMGR